MITRASIPFGDLAAPRDSVAYATAVRMAAQASLNSHASDVKDLEVWIDTLFQENRYQKLTNADGKPFWSWKQFCEAKQPWGLGYSPDAIGAILEERRTAQALAKDRSVLPLEKHGEIGNGRERRVDIINSTHQGGTDPTYLVRRLKRDRPDIAEALAEGKFRSAYAAAKAAGIVKEPTPLQRIQAAWKHASLEDKQKIVGWLQDQLHADTDLLESL